MRTGPRFLPALLGALAVCAHAATARAYVYWANGNDVGRANLDDSGVNDSFIQGANTSSGLAVYGSHVYWGDGQAIARSNLDGSDPQPTFITNDTSPFVAAITTDGNYIYWVTYGANIYRASLDGAGATDLVASAGSGLLSLTYADDTLYYASGSTIYSVPAAGGHPEPFTTLTGIGVDAPPLVEGIATANGVLYWSEVTNSNEGTFGDIGRASISPPQDLDETFVSLLEEPGGVATDGTYVYWTDVGTTPNEIGRAAIAAPAGAVDDFVTEPGHLQDGIAVNAAIDPTTTSVTCTPTTVLVGKPSSCTVTVSDTASTAVPTGTVDFAGAFFSGSPCSLTPSSGGGATCSADADLTSAGTQTIKATYGGDPVHSPSSGTASLCAGTVAQCGGAAPPPPKQKPACVVPKLKGKTLAAARRLLSKAHCKLGKVTKPKHGHKLVVSSTKPPTGKKLANGAKIAVKLAPARKRSGR